MCFTSLSAEKKKVGGLIMWSARSKTGFPTAMQSCPDAPGTCKTFPGSWADHNRPPTIKYNEIVGILGGGFLGTFGLLSAMSRMMWESAAVLANCTRERRLRGLCRACLWPKEDVAPGRLTCCYRSRIVQGLLPQQPPAKQVVWG